MKTRIYNIIIIILTILAVALVASAIAVTVRGNEAENKEVTEPTCTEQGYTTYYTTDGEVEYIGDYVDALGHNYKASSWEWSEDYLTVYGVLTCSRCGETVTEKAVLSSEITSEPSEMRSGIIIYTATVTYDGKEYVDEKTSYIPPLSQISEYTAVTVAATCTEQGYTTYSSGSYYYVTYTETLGHDYELIQSVAATCNTWGYDIYECSRCGDTYTEYTDEPMGHTFEDGKCTVCGINNYVQLTDSDVQKGFSTPFYSAREYYVFGYSVNTSTAAYWTFGLGNDTGSETTYAIAALWINGEYVTKLCGFEYDYASFGYEYVTSYTTEFALEKGDFIEIYLVYYGTEEDQNVILTFSRSDEYTGETTDFDDTDFDETDDTVYYSIIYYDVLPDSGGIEYSCAISFSDTTAYEYQIVTIYIDLDGDGVEVYDVTVYDYSTEEEVTVYEIIANYSYSFIMPAGDVSVLVYIGEADG